MLPKAEVWPGKKGPRKTLGRFKQKMIKKNYTMKKLKEVIKKKYEPKEIEIPEVTYHLEEFKKLIVFNPRNPEEGVMVSVNKKDRLMLTRFVLTTLKKGLSKSAIRHLQTKG